MSRRRRPQSRTRLMSIYKVRAMARISTISSTFRASMAMAEPRFIQISNIRWYTSGSVASSWQLGTNGGLFVAVKSTGDNGLPVASYRQATGTVGTSGYWMDDATNGHEYYKSGSTNHAVPVNADTITSGGSPGPLLVDSGPYTEDGQSKCVVTQVKIANNATQGDKAAETLTWRYDEI